MTANEPETSAILPTAPDVLQGSAGANTSAGADDELWLTYLNYDPAVQQAVRRLGALSGANVDVFRALLLKGRDRSRIKEYEADAIRRLQGEVFVGDEELQRALIVLNAEDPRLGDEFKRVVSTTGRPSDLDQMVTAIRSQTEFAAKPDPTKIERLPHKPPPTPASEVPELLRPPPPAGLEEPPHSQQAVPATTILEMAEPQHTPHISWTKRLAISGVFFLVVATVLVIVSSRLAINNTRGGASFQATTVPLRPATDENGQTVAPERSAQRLPTPMIEIAKPAQSPAQNQSSGRAAPPASGRPDKPLPGKDVSAPPPPDASPTAAPIPGAHYRIMRGDMLTEIAAKAYKDASKFVLIQRANPSLRDHPDKIYFDQVIYIPPAP